MALAWAVSQVKVIETLIVFPPCSAADRGGLPILNQTTNG
jgi:hypothetical protein